MKYAYYPGCSLSSTGVEYGISTRLVASSIGLELQEIPDWNCCGASSAHCTDHLLSLALPARTLAQAEQMGLDLAVPCAGCFNRLKGAENAIKNPEQKAKIEATIGMKLTGTSWSYSLLDIIVNHVGLEEIKARVKRPFENMKLASYYGCLLVRPSNITGFDDPENPQSMDKLMTALGGVALNWPFKTECCGGNLAVPRTDIIMQMSYDIINIAKQAGADAIVTACPLCMVNLDMRQTQIEKEFKTKLQIPVFYFTELIGLALGIDADALGIKKHFVNPKQFCDKWDGKRKAVFETTMGEVKKRKAVFQTIMGEAKEGKA